jgi:hypothetical protein
VEHFRATQRVWRAWGIAVLVALLVLVATALPDLSYVLRLPK